MINVLLFEKSFFSPNIWIKVAFSCFPNFFRRKLSVSVVAGTPVQGTCRLLRMTTQIITFIYHFIFCKVLAKALSHLVFITER